MYSQESIYSIIPPKHIEQEKPPMHKSKHGVTPATGSTFHTKGTTVPFVSNIQGDALDQAVKDNACRTMGTVPGSNKSTPRDYKASTAQRVPTLAEVKRCNPELLQPTQLKPRLKGGIPPKAEAPVMNLVSSKNFVVANAVETILAAPKKPTETAKDYLNKEDYGKVPKYLYHIKKDIEAEYEYIKQLEARVSDQHRDRAQPLDEEKRSELIAGLKQKWEAVNTDYQATTHLTKLDTIGKTKRKESYESQLSQIEKDIEKLNRKNIIVDHFH